MTRCALGLLIAFSAGPLAAQGALRVGLPDGRSVTLTADELRRLARDTVAYAGHGTTPTRYLAASIPGLLRRVGVMVDSVRGPRTTWVVVATASDSFRTSFSLGELAEYLGPTRAWLAIGTLEGPLPASEGPYRLIVPTDRRPSRGARMVVALDVVDANPAAGRR